MKRNVVFVTTVAVFIVVVIIGIAILDRRGSSSRHPEVEGMARGTVFFDRNGNGTRDRGEPGLAGVRVSDQLTVTKTDRLGRWELPAHQEAVYFVIKPRSYMTPLSDENLPRFYYLHKETEPLRLQSPTVPRSGPLPSSIDFPLVRQFEPDRFEAVIMGDPQPRDLTEVNWFAHDILEELNGTNALFAITLGDLTFDNLANYPAINQAVGTVGIPFYHVLGNHDANYDGGTDTHHHYETWRAFYGPPYYSFDYGRVHFVILADVLYPEGGTRYIAGLGQRQLDWLEADLSFVPKNQLVVLAMHIQLGSAERTPDFGRLYGLLQDRPHTLSFSAHSHTLTHMFLDMTVGWPGPEPHHHINAGAACGRWWAGETDETDIPHATGSDGIPNGYFIVTFDGDGYSTRYKAARRPADYQMFIAVPDEVFRVELADTPILANIFNSSTRSRVEMSVGDSGEWIEMWHSPQPDPIYSRVAARQSEQQGNRSSQMWEGRLPVELPAGGHLIRVRTTDMHGQFYTGSRIIRVLEGERPQ
jgi:hypothetical protein